MANPEKKVRSELDERKYQSEFSQGLATHILSTPLYTPHFAARSQYFDSHRSKEEDNISLAQSLSLSETESEKSKSREFLEVLKLSKKEHVSDNERQAQIAIQLSHQDAALENALQQSALEESARLKSPVHLSPTTNNRSKQKELIFLLAQQINETAQALNAERELKKKDEMMLNHFSTTVLLGVETRVNESNASLEQSRLILDQELAKKPNSIDQNKLKNYFQDFYNALSTFQKATKSHTDTLNEIKTRKLKLSEQLTRIQTLDSQLTAFKKIQSTLAAPNKDQYLTTVLNWIQKTSEVEEELYNKALMLSELLEENKFVMWLKDATSDRIDRKAKHEVLEKHKMKFEKLINEADVIHTQALELRDEYNKIEKLNAEILKDLLNNSDLTSSDNLIKRSFLEEIFDYATYCLRALDERIVDLHSIPSLFPSNTHETSASSDPKPTGTADSLVNETNKNQHNCESTKILEQRLINKRLELLRQQYKETLKTQTLDTTAPAQAIVYKLKLAHQNFQTSQKRSEVFRNLTF